MFAGCMVLVLATAHLNEVMRAFRVLYWLVTSRYVQVPQESVAGPAPYSLRVWSCPDVSVAQGSSNVVRLEKTHSDD